MSTDLQIEVSQMEGRVPVTVLRVSGQVDASNNQSLQNKATEVYEGGARNILLDLENVDYMSSAGFRVMHSVYTMLKDSGDDNSTLKLLKPSDAISRILKTLGFDTEFSSHSDLKEAVDAF